MKRIAATEKTLEQFGRSSMDGWGRADRSGSRGTDECCGFDGLYPQLDVTVPV
jgi:hypothetical protein